MKTIILDVFGLTDENEIPNLHQSLINIGAESVTITFSDHTILINCAENIEDKTFIEVVHRCGYTSKLLTSFSDSKREESDREIPIQEEKEIIKPLFGDEDLDYNDNISKLELRISGMRGVACVSTIESALLSQTGVVSASVSLLQESAVVVFNTRVITQTRLTNIISSLGNYQVEVKADNILHLRIYIENLHDPLDVYYIETTLAQLNGIESVQCSLTLRLLSIDYDPYLLTPETLNSAVQAMGFHIVDFSTLISANPYFSSIIYLLIPSIFSIIMQIFSFTSALSTPEFSSITVYSLFLFISSMFVQVFVRSNYSYAFRILFTQKRINDMVIQVLVSLLTLIIGVSGFFYSLLADSPINNDIVRPLEINTLLWFFIYLDYYLTHRFNSTYIFSFFHRLNLLTFNSNLESEMSEMYRVDNIITIDPNSYIPVDAIIEEGHSHVDESVILGESSFQSIEKHIGDVIFAGTFNVDSPLTVRILNVGKNTFLHKIVIYLESSQSNFFPDTLENSLFTVSKFFPSTRLSLIIFFVTFFSWIIVNQFAPIDSESPYMLFFYFALSFILFHSVRSHSIIIPYNISMSTNMAMQKYGVVLQSGVSLLEKLKKLTTIAFNLSTTLLSGRKILKRFLETTDKHSVSSLFFYAGSAEIDVKNSPVSEAIVIAACNKLSDKSLTHPTKLVNNGLGISCNVSNHSIHIGNIKYIKEHINYRKDVEIENTILTYENEGSVVVLLVIDDEISAILALSDNLRVQSKLFVDELHLRELNTYILTGSTQRYTSQIAAQVNIPTAKALNELTTAEKKNQIKQLQSLDHNVGYVGNPCTEGSLLSASNLSIAFDVRSLFSNLMKIDNYDILLLGSDLCDFVKVYDLCKYTLKNISSSFFVLFLFQILLSLISIGLFYPFWYLSLPPELAIFFAFISPIVIMFVSLLPNRYAPHFVSMDSIYLSQRDYGLLNDEVLDANISMP